MPIVVRRSISEPLRTGLSWREMWDKEDRGLIQCWENGRQMINQSPELVEAARKGELPVLCWKGGITNKRKLKITEKYGSLRYLATWKGMRGEDLCIDLDEEITVVCSRSGVSVTFTLDISNLDSDSERLTITDQFKQCLDEVRLGLNLLITGKAGTGKSTLLRLLCEKNSNKEIAVVAPTGVAALNISGETIHRLFGFRQGLTSDLKKYSAPSYLADLDILVIDEVSMVSAELLDMVSRALQFARSSRDPFGGIQVVLFGDLFQLPPVDDDEPRDTHYATNFFFSSNAFQESNFKTIELTQVFRQKDPVFIDILNAIRDGSVTEEHLNVLNTRFVPDYRNASTPDETGKRSRSMIIATRRDYVKQINEQHLEAIQSPSQVYSASWEGQIDDKVFNDLKELHLKPGAQVMLLVNQDGYANGTVAEVRELSPDVVTVYVPDLDELREVQRHVWEIRKSTRIDGRLEKSIVARFTQFPIQLAWAVTVHKSQGKTFDRVIFHCKSVFSDGQTYVALSRCTSLDGITLTEPVESNDVKVSPDVLRFYRSSVAQKTPIMSTPIVFVGLHTTGFDKYRKLVEVALIRIEQGVEVLRMSSLIAPGRDASGAASLGINASDLSMCPSIEEVRDLIGLAIDGASVVGHRVHDLFSLSNWAQPDVDEGVPYELGNVSFSEGEQPTAMELAEKAMHDFDRLHATYKSRIQTAPFRFHKQTVNPNSFILARSQLQGIDYLCGSNAFRSLDLQSQAAARLGLAITFIANRSDRDLVIAKQLMRHTRSSPCQVKEMWQCLKQKAEKDQCISADESWLLNRFSEEFELGKETVFETDNRLRTHFRDGMKIYLSGGPGKAGSKCEGMSKEDVRSRCENRGLIFLEKFRQRDKPDAVVVADLSTEGRSRADAQRWGIPIMSWEELLNWATSEPDTDEISDA
jgi:hypothetical protein